MESTKTSIYIYINRIISSHNCVKNVRLHLFYDVEISRGRIPNRTMYIHVSMKLPTKDRPPLMKGFEIGWVVFLVGSLKDETDYKEVREEISR